MQPVPFRRGPFAELPRLPRKPHAFQRTRERIVEVHTPELGATRASVRVFGSGPPLLVVHGLMTSSYSWRYVYEPLGRHFTVYAPDLLGNGGSLAALEPSYGPAALADWLGALQGALGIRGCAVIGNSMGGYLAMWLALRDPGAMSCLVNMHSPGLPELRLGALGALLALPFARELLAWYVRRAPQRWVHRHVHYYDESLKSLEEAEEYGRPLATPEGSRAFVKHLAETMAVGATREFLALLEARRAAGERFPVPLLLLYAESDPMVPPAMGERFAELIPGARLVRLTEASHFAHVDAVERFLPPVLTFLGVARPLLHPA
jgi:pimeloyl-ACP methyl ester carboxylesterase